LLGGLALIRRDQRHRTDAAALRALELAERGEIEARSTSDPARMADATAEARRAEILLDSGGGCRALRDRTREVLAALLARERDRRMIQDLDDARVQRTNIQSDRFDAKSMHDAFLALFRSYGIDLNALQPREAADRIRSSKIREQLAVALDEWAVGDPKNVASSRLREIASAASDDAEAAMIRDAIARKDTGQVRRSVENADARKRFKSRFNLISMYLTDVDPRATLPLLRSMQEEDPSDFWRNNNLAHACMSVRPALVDEAARFYTAAVALRPTSQTVRSNLGVMLYTKGDYVAAESSYREAIRLKPDDAFAYDNLGLALAKRGDEAAALNAFREAVRLKPDLHQAHNNIGIVLGNMGDMEGQAAAYRESIRLNPDYYQAHNNLAGYFLDKGDFEAAAASLRQVVRLRPDDPMSHRKLADALQRRGDFAGAAASFREAIRIEPKNANLQLKLGIALRLRGDSAAAVAAIRDAVRLSPNYAEAHDELGYTLLALGDRPGALSEFREAVRLYPEHARYQFNLGSALLDEVDLEAAVAALRTSVRLVPNRAATHVLLGNALLAMGDAEGAAAAQREAVRLEPKEPAPHANLGLALKALGRFPEALASFRLGQERAAKIPNSPYQLANAIRECERLVALDARLPEVLKGQFVPDDWGDRLALPILFSVRGLHAASARSYGELFATRPSLADDLGAGYRTSAAVAAIKAGLGRGKDNPPPDDKARAELRAKALGWLRADMAAYEKFSGTAPPQGRRQVVTNLALWGYRIADMRDPAAIENLPEPERAAVRSFWSDVDALRKKARAGPTFTVTR
jgi:Flp pilus assembly protein TadD